MSPRLVLASMAAAAMLTIGGSAGVPTANAMPVAAPFAAPSPEAVAPGTSGLIEKAYWRRWGYRRWGYRRWGWGGGWGYRRHGWCYWHPYRCGRY